MDKIKSSLSVLLARADAAQEANTWLAFPWAVLKKFNQDSASSLAGLVAYHGLLSVFPLLLVFAAALNLVLHGQSGIESQILSAARQDFPGFAPYLTVGSVSTNGATVGVGLVVALWAGLGVTRAAERAFNGVWNVPMARRPNFWVARLRGLGMLALLGTTVVVSTGLAALGQVGGPLGFAFAAVAVIGPLGVNVALYLLSFQLLTNIHVAWSRLVPGALLGAAGWTLLQNLGSLYIRHEVTSAQPIYGSFAIVIALLAWIYLGAELTLVAAELNVVHAKHLWPRSLIGPPRTEADRRAQALLVAEARRTAVERAAGGGQSGSALR